MSDRPLTDFGQITSQIMEALPMSIVLLDQRGDIGWSNLGWSVLRSPGVESPNSSLNVSYAGKLADALRIDDGDVERILRGIDDVRAGRQEFFSVDCAVHSTAETCWLCVTATLIDLSEIALYHAIAKGEDRVTVYHDAMEMPVNQRHDPFKFPRPN